MKKTTQFLLIISGFAIGQGSMFLAQTWLVINDKLELLASVGIGLGILSLFQWAADCGGIYLLPRQLSESNFRRRFWAFVFARLLFSILFVVIVIALLQLIGVDQTIIDIALFGSLSAFVWSFNISGILDYKRLNQYAGPLSGLCWIFASVPVVFMNEMEIFGVAIGIAYATGLFVTLQIQFLGLRNSGLRLKPVVVSLSLFKEQFVLGSKYNGAYITSQTYGRTIPILVDKIIDSYYAGIYVYAKNIANTASQFVEFSRRVEFNSILQLATSNTLALRSMLGKQKLSFLIIGLFFLGSILGYFASVLYENADYIAIAEVSLILIGILILWVLSSSFGQVLIALGKTGFYALTITITLIISITFIYFSIGHIGLLGVYIGEGFIFIAQAIVFIAYITKLNVRTSRI